MRDRFANAFVLLWWGIDIDFERSVESLMLGLVDVVRRLNNYYISDRS